jgi:hypothetical protein
MHAAPGDDDLVERAVELAVAASVGRCGIVWCPVGAAVNAPEGVHAAGVGGVGVVDGSVPEREPVQAAGLMLATLAPSRRRVWIVFETRRRTLSYGDLPYGVLLGSAP